jgi:hypothetical protein
MEGLFVPAIPRAPPSLPDQVVLPGLQIFMNTVSTMELVG